MTVFNSLQAGGTLDSAEAGGPSAGAIQGNPPLIGEEDEEEEGEEGENLFFARKKRILISGRRGCSSSGRTNTYYSRRIQIIIIIIRRASGPGRVRSRTTLSVYLCTQYLLTYIEGVSQEPWIPKLPGSKRAVLLENAT